MSAEIDLLKFEQLSGRLTWLPAVAAAFLQQLPKWRLDFATALATHNLVDQLELLHKIKGSCYAVAAYNTVKVISQAQEAHALGLPLAPLELLLQLERVEAELRTIVVNAPPQ